MCQFYDNERKRLACAVAVLADKPIVYFHYYRIVGTLLSADVGCRSSLSADLDGSCSMVLKAKSLVKPPIRCG